jgi:hypothetical protein
MSSHSQGPGAKTTQTGYTSEAPRTSFNTTHRPAGGDRVELLDTAGADAGIPVVNVDGRVAMAGDQADLVAAPEPVGSGRRREPAVLVGGAYRLRQLERGLTASSALTASRSLSGRWPLN